MSAGTPLPGAEERWDQPGRIQALVNDLDDLAGAISMADIDATAWPDELLMEVLRAQANLGGALAEVLADRQRAAAEATAARHPGGEPA